MNETTMVRMRLDTLKMLMSVFPAMKQESMASYFSRLAHYMKERYA